MNPTLKFLFVLGACGLSVPALAEKADREKPVNLEADKVTVDERTRTHTFEGKVQLLQGTLAIRADKIVVTQDPEGYQKGIATGGEGGLARFKQKRDGRDEWIEGEAERIEHDTRNEKTSFFTRAYVKSGGDEVRGQYIQYDSITENYMVTNGPNASTVSSGGNPSQRVRAIIQPKIKPAADGAAPSPQAPAQPGR